MDTVTITIRTGNSAFDDNPYYELVRILRQLALDLERYGPDAPIKLFDFNGNHVGEITTSWK
jgi:hypothetical protein